MDPRWRGGINRGDSRGNRPATKVCGVVNEFSEECEVLDHLDDTSKLVYICSRDDVGIHPRSPLGPSCGVGGSSETLVDNLHAHALFVFVLDGWEE